MLNKYIKLEQTDKRIIAISDIHGNIHLLDKLLKKINYCEDDILIILGDFLQRGFHNDETLNRMISWSKKDNIFILSGNHEHYVCSLLEPKYIERLDYHLKNIHYGCLIREWLSTENLSLEEIQNNLKNEKFEALEFLRELPYALEVNNYLFIHGGIDGTYENSDTWSKLSFPEFMKANHMYAGYVIVGHWPLQNYDHQSLCGDIRFDHQKRIIGIDGGYGIKKCGQLNALVITDTFESVAIDDLKPIILVEDVEVSNDWVVKLDYDDKAFEVIEYKSEFSLAKKVSTHEYFLIKNELIDVDFGDYICNFINGKKDTKGKLIDYYGLYALIKYDGKVGWVERKSVREI